jgi:hypothetical protein
MKAQAKMKIRTPTVYSLRFSIVIALVLTLLTPMTTPALAVEDGLVNCGTSGTFTIVSNIVTTNNLCVGSLNIPEGVSEIKRDAFNIAPERSSYITAITFPNSLRTIQESAFRRAYLLTSLNFGTGVQTISHWNFADSTELTAVTIPSSLTSMGVGVFLDSTKLQSVTFLGNAPSVDQYVFLRVPVGATANVNSSATGFGANGSTWNNLVVSVALAAPSFTISSASGSATTGSAITSYTLDASGGGTVESYAISPAISNGTLSFSTSTGLLSGTPSTAAGATTYTITAHNAIAPDATRTYALTINPAAYSSGTGAVDCGTSGYFSVSGNVVTGNSSCAGTAVIPSGVTNIADEAFSANALVTSVYIPSTVLTIGEAAFYEDTSLATITFQANSLLTTIGNSVFERTAITTIALPNSITSLGNYAFYNVTSLVSITLPNTITNIFEHTFDGCSSLASINIPNTVESFGIDSFKNTTSLASVTYHGPASYASLTAVGINTAALTIATITITNVVIIAPATSATPVSSLSSNGQFSTSIAWSGSPTTFASATAYTATITLTPVNSYTLADVSANFFTINGSVATSGNLINAGVFTFRFPTTAAIVPLVVYVPPAPVPYLKKLTPPRLLIYSGDRSKLYCSAGMYQFGYTIDGVVQGTPAPYVKPSSYIFNLLLNGVAQSLLTITTKDPVPFWSATDLPSGSIASCSVTVTVNTLTNTATSMDLSDENKSKLNTASAKQNQSIRDANALYMLMSMINSNTYQDTLDSNRAAWRAAAESIPVNYRAELARIKTLAPTKETRALTTALRKNYMAALKKNAADYRASGPAALVAKNHANQLALDQKNAWITAADASYGSFIESIGYGVLIP